MVIRSDQKRDDSRRELVGAIALCRLVPTCAGWGVRAQQGKHAAQASA